MWPETAADGPAFTSRYTAKAVEKIEDVETLKVAAELKESGTGGILLTGFYWFDGEGIVRKFDLDIRNSLAALTPTLSHRERGYIIGSMKK
ncbi:MAG: hypothetical protein C4341_07775 [Armatimonadota bacterium]